MDRMSVNFRCWLQTVRSVQYLVWRRVPVDGPERPEEGVNCVGNSDAVDPNTPFAQAPFSWWQGLGDCHAAP